MNSLVTGSFPMSKRLKSMSAPNDEGGTPIVSGLPSIGMTQSETTFNRPYSMDALTSMHVTQELSLPRSLSASAIEVRVNAALSDFDMTDRASSSESEEARWIRKKLKRRQCTAFVQAESSSSPNGDPLCQCGHDLSEHSNPEAAKEKGQELETSEWNHRTHASPSPHPTNAFGEIDFLDNRDQAAKYVCVDAETDMGLLKTLMTEVWHMEKPNLLISVTGGAKNFQMGSHLKDAFRRGLMKAALGTGAWIVTGGTNNGVMKHVGEAVRDYGLTAEGIVCIGIAAWGCVQGRKALESGTHGEKGKWPAEYQIQGQQKCYEAFLDPNHSHFILVDNGTRHKFATEIEFRARLEKEISLMTANTGSADAVPVPVCLLVLEGGHGTLEQVMNAVQNNTPTIVVKGSGKCADVLAYAAQNVTQKKDKLNEDVKKTLREMVTKAFRPKTSAQHRTWVGWVEQCIQKPHLLSVVELQASGATPDGEVDVAILKALLKANQNSVTDQLKLALAWNRIDIAKSEIFTDGRHKRIKDLDEMMMSAIQLNRVDFVDLFLDNGVPLRGFLTVGRLLKLYRRIPTNCLLYERLMKLVSKMDEITLKHVGLLLQKLLGNYYQSDYLMSDSCEDERKPREIPAQDLFLWAVLMNQKDLAKLFWTKGNEATAAALVANGLLKAMMKRTTDADVLQQLQENADEFENLAIGVITSCYLHDEGRAQVLLVREMTNWGKATCVLIAVQADNKRFISQTACQSLLNSIWMGNMSQDNGFIRLIPSLFFFPLILRIIKFKQEKQTNKTLTNRPPPLKRETTRRDVNSDIPVESKPEKLELSNWEKICLFYTAPVIIFHLNWISYLVFLTLFSYVLLVQLSWEFHFVEGILIFWVFTIFLEELRQMKTNYTQSAGSKLVAYLSSSWNVLDIFTILLFTVGIILRAIPNRTSFDIARVVLALNLISFFFRILHIFSVNKELGPKLVMIRRMIRDLMWFVVILMVFITAYAIASEAILYPQSELSWKLLYNLPRKAYWQIYGELFLDEIEGNSPCPLDPSEYNSSEAARCPSSVGTYLVPVLMGVYVLMTNVLLLNLLIAMFSYTFQKVQNHTDVHWCYQRFNLVREYYERPWLPPPFIVFSHLYLMVMWCVDKCSFSPLESDFCKRFGDVQNEKKLVQWENIIADTYVTRMEARIANSVENKVKDMMNKLEAVQATVEELVDMQTCTDPFTEAGPESSSNSNRYSSSSHAPRVSVAAAQQGARQEMLSSLSRMDDRLGDLEEQMGTALRTLDKILQAMERPGTPNSVTVAELESTA